MSYLFQKDIIQEIIKLSCPFSCKSSVHGPPLLTQHLLKMCIKNSQCENYNLGIMKIPLFIYLFFAPFLSLHLSIGVSEGIVMYKLIPLCFQTHLYLVLQSLLLTPLILTFKYYFTLLFKCSICASSVSSKY